MFQFERDVLTIDLYFAFDWFITYENIFKFRRDVLTSDLCLAIYDFVDMFKF